MEIGDGMKQVMIVPYDSIWQHLYIGEQLRLKQVVHSTCNIYHIGSTAIPGMDARATVDIALEGHIDCETLASLGYEFICKQEEHTLYATHDHKFHLFVYESNNEELKRRLKLRDYFRAYASERERYSQFKVDLAKVYPFDFSSYKKARDIFLTVIEEKAMQWDGLHTIKKFG